MRNLVFLLVLILSAALQGNAQKQDKIFVTISDITGNDLFRHCNSHEPFELNFCVGYVEGVRDGMAFTSVGFNSKSLIDEPSRVTSDQLKDIVLKYLKDHPETRHKAAGMLTIWALQEAFPRQP